MTEFIDVPLPLPELEATDEHRPASDPPLSAGRRRTLRQQAEIAAGCHPLTGQPTRPDLGTCGTCLHRRPLDPSHPQLPEMLTRRRPRPSEHMAPRDTWRSDRRPRMVARLPRLDGETMTRSWTIRLAYPTLPLSLNDRMHYQERARVVRNLREQVRAYARHLNIPRLDAIHVAVTFTPSTRRRRDQDNAVATLKPIIDGLRDYPRRVAGRMIVQPGVVPDDTPEHVTWTPPTITEPNPDRNLTERLVITITERSAHT